MVVKGRTGERGNDKFPLIAGSDSALGGSGSNPAQSSQSFSSLFSQGRVQPPLLGYSTDVERFRSQAAEDFGKCFGGEL